MSIYPIFILRSLGLSDQNLIQLASKVTEQTFAAKDVVLQKGASAFSMYYVIDGFVSASLPDGSRELAPMDIYGQGNWFGEQTLFSPHPSALEYTCLTATRVLMIPSQDAKEAYNGDSRFAQQIGGFVAWRSQRHSEMLSLLSAGNPALRVILGLALLAESIHYGAPNLPVTESLNIPLRQSLLASICGLSRGVFSQHILQLVVGGWLSTNYSTTTLHKLPGWREAIRTHRETRLVDVKPSMAELLAIMSQLEEKVHA